MGMASILLIVLQHAWGLVPDTLWLIIIIIINKKDQSVSK